MEDYCDEEKVMNFMAMTECANRDTAIRVLEMSNWDEITAANAYFADKSHPPPQPRTRDLGQPQRLIDDFGYEYDSNYNLKDGQSSIFPKFEAPSIFSGISNFFGGIKDQVFGVGGGKYFLKELNEKYPDTDFSGINFE